MERITSINKLFKIAAEQEEIDCYISFRGGLKSSKHIISDGDNAIWVLSYVDDSERYVTKKDITDTTIGQAILHGKFYMED